MPKATWNGATIAESDDTVLVEGNHYFPIEAVNKKYLRESHHNSFCFWKGVASYYDIIVDGETNPNAAWYYPTPSRAARRITGRVAFWKGVRVEP
jgi:uncharacterized protein (DUF427 family)